MTSIPKHVADMEKRLIELWPGARVEIEPRWFVRAYGANDLCVDVRNLPGEIPD